MDVRRCGRNPGSRTGISKTVIKPNPDARLKYVDCKMETAAGIYESHWKYEEDGSGNISFHVPFGAKALICLPDGRSKTVAAGDYIYLQLMKLLAKRRREMNRER